MELSVAVVKACDGGEHGGDDEASDNGYDRRRGGCPIASFCSGYGCSCWNSPGSLQVRQSDPTRRISVIAPGSGSGHRTPVSGVFAAGAGASCRCHYWVSRCQECRMMAAGRPTVMKGMAARTSQTAVWLMVRSFWQVLNVAAHEANCYDEGGVGRVPEDHGPCAQWNCFDSGTRLLQDHYCCGEGHHSRLPGWPRHFRLRRGFRCRCGRGASPPPSVVHRLKCSPRKAGIPETKGSIASIMSHHETIPNLSFVQDFEDGGGGDGMAMDTQNTMYIFRWKVMASGSSWG